MARLDAFHGMIVSKYFTRLVDYFVFSTVSTKFKDNTSKFHFNPIPLRLADIKHFERIETLHIWSCNAETFGQNVAGCKISNTTTKHNFFQIIVWFKVSLSTFLTNNTKNVVYKNVGLFKDDSVHFDDKITNTLCSFENFCFMKNTTLQNIVISNNVTSLCNSVFEGCKRLSAVSLSHNLVTIGYSCFNGCECLVNIKIPHRVSSISNCFDGCRALTIDIPADVTKFGDKVVCGMTKMFGFVLGNARYKAFQVTDYSCYCTPNIDLTTIKNPHFMKTIKERQSGVECPLIDIPTCVTFIAKTAFGGNRDFSCINIPHSVTQLDSFCFSGCKRLREVTLPTSVSRIAPSTFENCISLTKIAIPSTISIVESVAFRHCEALKSIIFCGNISTIGISVFCACTSLSEVNVLDWVNEIPDWCFYECSSLDSVVIPDCINRIGNNSFNGCASLSSVQIPRSVTFIGVSAFGKCYNLLEVVIPKSIKVVGQHAFPNKTKVKKK
ncbi:hypothetical protein EIN_122860 [Entamoeba invadens IP1]|uniref:Leucine rich repeat containing protein BspA family protein n=1 Tax=Entamoeba invadens IP1 TaxID=370355 RepID=A0A0A1UB54_ENTIV|nr:hypothetical protein EIN_122860 [Entamoeba invadens IP1]ELP92335.1 hypothetical protein EIN_122860 [Entamoeba invadens IP1]|eukprot:XP_004259106.1 hypothetical protein EIN_122860 [Entamoeba invadens IP1]